MSNSRILQGSVTISNPVLNHFEFYEKQGTIVSTNQRGYMVKISGSKKMLEFKPEEIRQTTLLEFLFSIHGFGRWKWWQTIPTLLGFFFGMIYCAINHRDFDPIWSGWATSAFCLFALVLITYKQNQLRLGKIR